MKRAEKLKRSFISMFIVSFVFVFSFGTTGKESKDVEALPLAFVVDRTKYVSMERTPTALVGKFYNECETVVTEILEPSVDAIQVTDSVLLSNGIHLMSSEYCDSTERLNLEVYAIADKAVRTHVDCVVNNETTKLGKSLS